MTSIKNKCNNITKANKYISELLSLYNEGDLIDNPIIMELIKYHPTKNIDFLNIDWIKLKKRKPFNTLSIFYKYKNSETDDDISWKQCIRNLYGKYCSITEKIKNINTAFRNESHIGTKKQFFIDNTRVINGKFIGSCKHCNSMTDTITTDHYPIPYAKIFDCFKNEYNINIDNINFIENDNLEIRLKDEELAKTWLIYHDNIAKYRLLCNSCNSHFGSYGFK
jgi:hypothetical protein